MTDTQRKPKKERRSILFSNESSLAETAVAYLLFAALGALLCSAELLFGVRPFGVALIAGLDRLAPAAAAGGVLFCLFTKDYDSLLAIGVTLFCRLLLSLFLTKDKKAIPAFTERVGFRAAAAAFAVLIGGFFRLWRGNFRYYYLFGLLLAVASAALLTFFFSGISEKKDKPFPHAFEVGVAALTLASIFALRDVEIFGIFPASVAAAGIAFLLTAHRDMLYGAIGGALSGLAFMPKFAPAFLLAAIGFGLLQKSSRGGGVLAGAAAATAYIFALSGTEGIYRLLPSLLTAGALFLAGDSAGLVAGSPAHRAGVTARRNALLAAKAEEQAAFAARLCDISGALSDLSGTFFELSNRLRRPGGGDLKHLCDQSFDSVCPNCAHRDICWGREYTQTAAAVGGLALRLQEKGSVGREELPAPLIARCAALPEILERINAGAVRLTENTLRGDKTSVVASDYAALSRVMRETMDEEKENFAADTAKGAKIAEKLSAQGYFLESATVCGEKYRRVILRGLRSPGRHLKIRELRERIVKICRFALGEPEIRESDGVFDIVFPERERFFSSSVRDTRAKNKKNSRYCGDTVTSFQSDTGKDFALLCDGMGSGNAAALTSALAGTFLSRMLVSGNRPETTLRMLNAFLASRGAREAESSTTVDLLMIDRVNGEASLFKCGAAPSFLLRDGEVTRFFSRTAPIGILESLDAERIRFSVLPGDVIVQVSDGVTDGDEDCPWLSDLLKTKWVGDAESFARLVLNRADTDGKDDTSVLITEIGNAAPEAAEKESA